MKANILFVVPNPSDATSWYRAYGPFGALRKENEGLNIVTGVQNFRWPVFQMTDITFMQRPYSGEHLEICKMAKENNNKLWLDYDDDLFCVPNDNPAHDLYSQESIQKNIATMIAMADVVTVSTVYLKSRIEKLNSNVVVINNALNDYILEPIETKPFADRPKFFNWRGSNTHQNDIMIYSMDIIEVAKRNENWQWHWIGYNPFFITNRVKKTIVSPSLDVMGYHKFIQKLQPTCQIVPLANNEFNKSKSNIAWIEAAYSGAITIAPDTSEWNRPGVLNYNSPEEFNEAMSYVTKLDDDVLEKMLEESRTMIQENYLLSDINQGREKIILDLMNG